MIRAQSFEEIIDALSGNVVLLDVDGTLLPDGDQQIPDETREAAIALCRANEVYLVSNGKDVARVKRFAEELGARLPERLPAGKPSARSLAGVDRTTKPVVVIGDKYLIDGIYARRIGARFLPVVRKRSGRERLSVRASFLLDRVVSWFL